MVYSLKQAADAAGIGKPAILKAIQKGKISANKNAHGQWEIDPAELHRVYPVKQNSNTGNGSGNSSEVNAGNTTLMMEITALKERLEAVHERDSLKDQIIDDLREDRNRWRQQATALLTDKQAANSPEKPAGPSRFWPWSRPTQKT